MEVCRVRSALFVYMKEIVVLGSTGSIGTQTLDVARMHGYKVKALSANSSVKLLEEQAREFVPEFICARTDEAYSDLKTRLADMNIKLFKGDDGLCELASVKCDMVVNSVVGMVGLRPTLAAIEAGNDIGLANKETMVVGGSIVTKAAAEKNVKILPIDSEHSAIFQCLMGNNDNKIEKTEVVGLEPAIRGMRNPKNSWDRSDSIKVYDHTECSDACVLGNRDRCGDCYLTAEAGVIVGENDHKLMSDLAAGGPVHAKYRRMIVVYVDITAPLYWWKEFDTYKVGTVANSCSTMHKIHAKEFTLDDFSHEHLLLNGLRVLKDTIVVLNGYREFYLRNKSKLDWWQMIQLLPSSYNQKRTVMLNYEVLANMYHSRKDHKLDEWRDLCKWIESLPYSELITGKDVERADG